MPSGHQARYHLWMPWFPSAWLQSRLEVSVLSDGVPVTVVVASSLSIGISTTFSTTFCEMTRPLVRRVFGVFLSPTTITSSSSSTLLLARRPLCWVTVDAGISVSSLILMTTRPKAGLALAMVGVVAAMLGAVSAVVGVSASGQVLLLGFGTRLRYYLQPQSLPPPPPPLSCRVVS